MDGKLVTDLSSAEDGGGGRSRPSPSLRYGDKFEELCGYYMSLGMSYSDYWDGDNCMTMVKEVISVKYLMEMYSMRVL